MRGRAAFVNLAVLFDAAESN